LSPRARTSFSDGIEVVVAVAVPFVSDAWMRAYRSTEKEVMALLDAFNERSNAAISTLRWPCSSGMLT
jgi:hypothetical protein